MLNLPELPQRPGTLAVKLKPAGERMVRSGHPWIFGDSIETAKDGDSGSIAVIFSKKGNRPIGVGLWDPDSPIRIKMLHHGGGAKIDTNFFSTQIQKAKAERKPLFETQTNSYRLLFGENDGFPGLIADVYAQVLVIKLYSNSWKPYLDWILPALLEQSGCETVVLRLSRKLMSGDDGWQDGLVIHGQLDDELVLFMEHGVLFTANVIKGHKTGYFLDHRANRKRVGELAAGKRILDVFSYAGGFSVHALAGGASSVTSVDISAQALEVAKANVALGNYPGQHHTLVGDAFVVLEQLIAEGQDFDLIVIDPPSFAKKATEVTMAKRKYHQLALLGAKLTAPGGILVLASCSSRVEQQSFLDINKAALSEAGRAYECFERTAHDLDHPVRFPEGAYLKCAYYRFLD